MNQEGSGERDDGPLLTVRDLAALVQVHPSTVYTWRWKQFGPPSLKVGRNVRYRRRDVLAWLAERQQPGAA